jgi:hypothetical protein
MADLFNTAGARPRNGRRSAQVEGEQQGIAEALAPPAPEAPTSTPPTYNDLTSAQGRVTPPSLRNGGIVAQGSDNPALGIVQPPQYGRAGEAGQGTGITPTGGLTTPIGLGNYANNLEGFNMGRFADPSGQGNNTWKYRVGSVLSNYAPTSDGLAQAAQFLQGQGVDVRQGGSNGDLLEFGAGITDENGNPIGSIDVGRGFGAAGSGWAWQPLSQTGSGHMGAGGGQDLNSAFSFLQQNIAPNANKEQMESAITQAFQNVPGFQGAYKESVNINGQWYDLVGGYGGANPNWQLMAKNDHGSGATGFSPSLGGGGLATGNVPGLQSGSGPSYAQQVIQMLLEDLGV